MAQVNPNTIQRAYREMEQSGLVETLRGQGTFVRNDASMVEDIRKEMASVRLGRVRSGDEGAWVHPPNRRLDSSGKRTKTGSGGWRMAVVEFQGVVETLSPESRRCEG